MAYNESGRSHCQYGEICSTNENQEVSLKTVDLNDESSTTTIDDTSTTTSISITTTTTLPVTTTTSSTTTTSLPTTISGIEEAQILLKNLGIYTGEIDGINGSLTKKAIREFQKLAGLVVDGVLGPNTINALINGENSYIDIGGADVEVSKTDYSEYIEDAQIKLKELKKYKLESLIIITNSIPIPYAILTSLTQDVSA